MAQGIGTRVVLGKHPLTIRGRDGKEAAELARKLGDTVRGEELSDSVDGDVIIFAIPYAAIPEVVQAYKTQLAGKILVDISNPVDLQTFELLPPAGSSGAEEIAKYVPEGARLVKAFNTTFAGTLLRGEVGGKELDVFVASDDEEAGETVARLADDGGLRGLYVGPLKRARALEGFQLIQMVLQKKLGTNWMSAMKILS